MAETEKDKGISHDQNFKNLILDYPRDSLRFFAEPEAFDLADDVEITPVRQEQLKDRLGDHFCELDTPLKVEWPDGSRAAALFVAEEETEAGTFSIHRMCRYCVHLSELMETDRVVPVAILLRSGKYPTSLVLAGDRHTFLRFEIIACDLKGIPVDRYMDSDNIVARVNLPNMAYDRDRRLEVYAKAREGLVELEPDPNRRIKYSEFIDMYAELDEKDLILYQKQYLKKSRYREVLMGLTQMAREEGMKEGRKEGTVLTLRRQLGIKFKAIPDWAEELLKNAVPNDLEQWTDRILTADTIEQVFGKGH